MSLILKVISFKGQSIQKPMLISFDRNGGTIGRSLSNDFVLPDPNRYISRCHAKIFFENGYYYLQDTSSSGIYLPNKNINLKMSSIILKDGDKIHIGDYELIVILQNIQSETNTSANDQSIDYPENDKPANLSTEPTIAIPEQFDFEELLSKEFSVAEPTTKTVQFTSYFPAEIKPEAWYTLLVYVHLSSVRNLVEEDIENRLDLKLRDYKKRRGEATSPVARGAEIIVIPELSGCRFNPPRASVLWLEDWHRLEFRMQAIEGVSGFELNTAKNGKISFYVGPILVAETNIWTYITNDQNSNYSQAFKANCTTNPYVAVFVSYSHNDNLLIQNLEKAYVALGMQYLRDVNILRSGEKWNRSLLEKILEADIFQLCWSKFAKESEYVEQEWRYALNLKRHSFVRPVYWENPMPTPPKELSDIHFAYLNIVL
jgi:pSer/pThr/pTyr-binding forkhead associated (FHA) protein